jgi:MYXO-CTERM domain-containing protein
METNQHDMKHTGMFKPVASSLAAASLLLLPIATTTTFAQTTSPEGSSMVQRDIGNAGLWGLLGLLGLAGLMRRRSEHTSTYAAREQQPGMPRR